MAKEKTEFEIRANTLKATASLGTEHGSLRKL
jgi:hypothetical protein